MVLGLVAGWILGAAALYSYLVITAREPRQPECMDCRLTDCLECPLVNEGIEPLRKAA